MTTKQTAPDAYLQHLPMIRETEREERRNVRLKRRLREEPAQEAKAGNPANTGVSAKETNR